jgi:hypothetical protein
MQWQPQILLHRQRHERAAAFGPMRDPIADDVLGAAAADVEPPWRGVGPPRRTVLQIARSAVVLPAPSAPIPDFQITIIQRADRPVSGAQCLGAQHGGDQAAVPR